MIVIPMAGESSRFFKEGYDVPKYKLPLWNRTVFDWVLLSFKRFFATEHFRFIVRRSFDDDNFVSSHVEQLGIRDYSIFELDAVTRGQAETVFLGIKDMIGEWPLLVFNIDTLRVDYQDPAFDEPVDGFLEVFHDEGSHWSFVEPDMAAGKRMVKRTTEKVRISDLCSNGLYQFKNAAEYCECCIRSFNSNETAKGEFYIAPLYNQLIGQGRKIAYVELDQNANLFCGTPDEYRALIDNSELGAALEKLYFS